MQWKDRKVLVLGLGDTGLSMARWLARRGARVSAADTRAEPPHRGTLAAEHPGMRVTCGGWKESEFRDADAIAVSPGIDRREGYLAAAIRRGVPVVGDVELFAQALPSVAEARGVPMSKVIAITGSNGKSTVTAMAGEACQATGRKTLVAGNIGLPVLDALAEIEKGAAVPDVVVLELSSFQLESTWSLQPDAATVLNVTEDHLDRYDGMPDYAAAKARIFQGARVQVLNREDRWSVGMRSTDCDAVSFGLDAPPSDADWGIAAGELVHGSRPVMPLNDIPVAGLHNAANALAALALGHAVGFETSAMAEGLRRFKGLSHRLERIASVRGVTFYDDSKGTNVGATVAALGGMSVPVVLIAGGDGKGQDFSPLAPAVSAKARAVVLIGRDGPAIGSVLRDSGVPLLRAGSMEEAVSTAFNAARSGDAVLLSPACASFDMFRSYVHRGQVFVAAVRALEEREGGGA